jgi:AcrR family transcriptional regulator
VTSPLEALGTPAAASARTPAAAALGTPAAVSARTPAAAALGTPAAASARTPAAAATGTPAETPREDGRRVRGDRTRRAILRAAVNIASVDGLEGLSIGRLASELKMSKSGLFAHFGSKEELQISTVRAAAAIFVHRVIQPAQEEHEPGLARLRAMLDIWLDYMEAGIFAGGCFFAAATSEMDGRPGPVRDAVAVQMSDWNRLLAESIGDAVARGELRADTDPEQVAFELDALGSAVNGVWQLHGDHAVFERGHRALRRRLEADATASGRAVLAAPHN